MATGPLHAAFTGDRTVVMAAVHDAMSAGLAAEAGFSAVCLGSSTVSNAVLGVADGGYIGLADMLFVLGKIAPYGTVPVIVDVDNGYGNAVNAVHTVRCLETAGAAGVMMEDQQVPPRTPSFGPVPVISRAEAIAKVHAVCDAREDRNFFVIARTDAVSAEGVDGAIERAKGFADVGADCVFVSSQDLSRADLERIGREVEVAHRLVSIGGPSAARQFGHEYTLDHLRELGFDMVATGIQVLRVAAVAMRAYLDDVMARGIEADRDAIRAMEGTPAADWATFTGFPQLWDLQHHYLPAAKGG